jgi:hypothetical protein
VTLRRLVLEFKAEELIVRALYRRSLEDGPNPGTMARAREVSHLAREGLIQALEALGEGDVTMAGTSGFTQREDSIVANRKESAA